jgi:hypothetical protein
MGITEPIDEYEKIIENNNCLNISRTLKKEKVKCL